MAIALDLNDLAALRPHPAFLRLRLRLLPDDRLLVFNDPFDPFAQQGSSTGRNSADIHRPDVYEPCDGSFALVDALLSERANLRDLQPSLCVEVGSGSGYVLTSLARMLADETNNTEYIATDLSEEASVSTLSTLRSHQICGGETFVADLVSGSEDQLAGSVDVLIFNPPYVLTYEEEEEVAVDGITGTCSGGDQGRTVINRMLIITDMLLSSKGLLYLLTTTGNNPGEICQIMKKKGFESRIVIQRFTDEESLHVLKFWRKSTFKECSSPGTSSPLRFLVSILPRYLSKFLSWFVVFKE